MSIKKGLYKESFGDSVVISLLKMEKGELLMRLSEITVLFVYLFLDYLTGVLVAVMEKKVNSAVGIKGIFNKVGIILCVIFCKMIDLLKIEGLSPLVPFVSFFFILNESFSILENLNKLNVPIPSFLISILESIQEKNKK